MTNRLGVLLTGAALALAAHPALAQDARSGTPPAPLTLPEEQDSPVGPPRGTIFTYSETIIITVRPAPLSSEEAKAMMPKGGMRCVRADMIAEGTLVDGRAVLLRMKSGDQLRLKLAQDCPDLGYYGGFYVSRQADRLCAGRDFLMARSGQRCPILEIAKTKSGR